MLELYVYEYDQVCSLDAISKVDVLYFGETLFSYGSCTLIILLSYIRCILTCVQVVDLQAEFKAIFKVSLGMSPFGDISASSKSSVNQSEARSRHHLDKLSSTMQAFVIRAIWNISTWTKTSLPVSIQLHYKKPDDGEDNQQNKACALSSQSNC